MYNFSLKSVLPICFLSTLTLASVADSSERNIIPISELPSSSTSTLVPAAESFLCVADHAAGLAFDKSAKRWAATTFKIDEKLLLTKVENADVINQGVQWMVNEVGSETPSFICKEGFSDTGYIYCEGIFGVFKFNRKNGRYLSTYTAGYVDDVLGKGWLDSEEGSNTPAIKAGKCSPLHTH